MPNTIELSSILKALQQATSTTNILQFIIEDVEAHIQSHSKNTLYWANQISWLKRSNSRTKNKEIKVYKAMIKKNGELINQYKKSLQLLKQTEKLLQKVEG